MIYEILIRGNGIQPISSDNLIWIESNLPTRSFEQWLINRKLLNTAEKAPVIRWSIIQTQRPAHFVLSTQAAEIEKRIAEIMNPAKQIKKVVGSVQNVPDFGISAFSLAA